MSQDLIGQVFLVTGATEGIGKAACLDFAKRGATLVLVGRNKSKTENVVADLERLSQNARISYLLGDLSSIQATKSIAKAFREKHKELHVLVNNAGAFFPRYQTSAEGYEMTFALNHLAYFVLTTSLLDILQNTRHSRIVNTASDAHLFAHLNVDTVAKRDGKHAGWRAYGDSKLANILFTRSLAKKLPPHTTIANCFHPGYVSSQFGLDQRFRVLSLAAKVNAQIFGRSPEKGAETLVWLATSPESRSFNGEYFHDCALHRSPKSAKDPKLAEALWKLSEELCAGATSGIPCIA